MLTAFSQLPWQPILEKFFSQEQMTFYAFHESKAAACCRSDNDKVKTKVSPSSKEKKVFFTADRYSTFRVKKGKWQATVTLRSVCFRVVFTTLDVHGRQDVRLLSGLKENTAQVGRPWPLPGRQPKPTAARHSPIPAGGHAVAALPVHPGLSPL